MENRTILVKILGETDCVRPKNSQVSKTLSRKGLLIIPFDGGPLNSSGLWTLVCLRLSYPFLDSLDLRIQRTRKSMEGFVFTVVNEGAHRLSIH